MAVADPTSKYGTTAFTEPSSRGYVYVGMRVDPPRRAPFVRGSRRREAAIARCREAAGELEKLDEVVGVSTYAAVLIPPLEHSPRFDVLMLIQTGTPSSTATVEQAEALRGLGADLVMPAYNARRIGDVDAPPSGTFLFNHFAAPDPEGALRTWEKITTWFLSEAGVSDSALLRPTGEAPYAFVNHVRLPCGPVRFMLRFAKPSFRKYVVANLKADQISNAPVICEPV